jgi:hypothetical protein
MSRGSSTRKVAPDTELFPREIWLVVRQNKKFSQDPKRAVLGTVVMNTIIDSVQQPHTEFLIFVTPFDFRYAVFGCGFIGNRYGDSSTELRAVSGCRLP